MTLIKFEGTTDIPHLVLNRPQQANALNGALLDALRTGLGKVIADGARAVVLRGAGRGFSAGADFGELTGTTADLAVDNRIAAVTSAIVGAPIPIIAALHGFCFGAAVDVAWSCDLVVATPMMRCGLPATRLGILYNPAALKRLYARLGSQLIRRLLLFGETFTGEAAWRLGAVAHLADDDTVLGALATEMAKSAVLGESKAVAATKQLLADLDMSRLDVASWQQERETLLASVERLNAVQARQRKRGKKAGHG